MKDHLETTMVKLLDLMERRESVGDEDYDGRISGRGDGCKNCRRDDEEKEG